MYTSRNIKRSTNRFIFPLPIATVDVTENFVLLCYSFMLFVTEIVLLYIYIVWRKSLTYEFSLGNSVHLNFKKQIAERNSIKFDL